MPDRLATRIVEEVMGICEDHMVLIPGHLMPDRYQRAFEDATAAVEALLREDDRTTGKD
jgi:hypothetical protein